MAIGPNWFDTTPFHESTCFPATTWLCTMCTTHPIITKAFLISTVFQKSATCQINCPSVGNFTTCRPWTALDFLHSITHLSISKVPLPSKQVFHFIKKRPSQPIDDLAPIPQNNSIYVQIHTSINQYLLINGMKGQPGHICLASIHDYKLNIPPMAPKTSNKELLFTWDAQPGSGKGYELSLSQGYLHST